MEQVGHREIRRYAFTLKELQEKLGIRGVPIKLGLWRGRSPKSVEEGVSEDTEEFYLDCKEESGRVD